MEGNKVRAPFFWKQGVSENRQDSFLTIAQRTTFQWLWAQRLGPAERFISFRGLLLVVFLREGLGGVCEPDAGYAHVLCLGNGLFYLGAFRLTGFDGIFVAVRRNPDPDLLAGIRSEADKFNSCPCP